MQPEASPAESGTMNRRSIILSCTALAVASTGCVQTAQKIQIEPTLATRTASSIRDSKDRIRLPQNYDPSNYKLLKVAASFYPLSATSPSQFSKLQNDVVASMMETEISKLKRFTILSRSQLGQQAIADEKRFQDRGTVRSQDFIRFGQQFGADYVLTAGIVLSSEKFDRVKEQELIYTVLVNYQLIEAKTGEIKEADRAEGRARRTAFELPSGRIVGGFNYRDPKELEVALNEASFNALKVIANKIGNKLPVGGKITGFRENAFQINAGHEQGLMGKQLVVVYTKDSGVDVPLARGEIEPGSKETRGVIIQWSNDPSVKGLIDQLRKDSKSFMLDYDLYAVSDGMPLPPEWDKNYSN
jgi:curli biogenesis system outer membrane secretion channel CsgG